MREIKFRGLVVINNDNKWHYGLLIRHGHKRFDNFEFAIQIDINNAYVVKTETIGQFTGLNDKNGIEIYEGDIVKFKSFHDDSNWIREVTYSGAAFYADYRLEDLVAVKDAFSVEVIGNIHQNQELLKQ